MSPHENAAYQYLPSHLFVAQMALADAADLDAVEEEADADDGSCGPALEELVARAQEEQAAILAENSDLQKQVSGPGRALHIARPASAVCSAAPIIRRRRCLLLLRDLLCTILACSWRMPWRSVVLMACTGTNCCSCSRVPVLRPAPPAGSLHPGRAQ